MRRLVLAIALVLAAVTPSVIAQATTATPPRTNPTPTPTPAPKSVPAITLSPASGPPYTIVAIDGSGFTPGGGVYTYVDTPAPGPPSGTIGADGHFTLSFGIGPIDIAPHSICVQVSVVVCSRFTVTPFQPTIKLQPSSGEPSQSFTITGSGFPPYEIVAIYVDSPDQLLSTPGPPADPTGSFTADALMRSVGSGPHDICGDTGLPAGTQQYVVKKCATYTVLGPTLGPVSPSPIDVASPSPTGVTTHNTAQVNSTPPILPIAGAIVLAIALGTGAFFGLRRRRSARP